MNGAVVDIGSSLSLDLEGWHYLLPSWYILSIYYLDWNGEQSQRFPHYLSSYYTGQEPIVKVTLISKQSQMYLCTWEL